MLYFWKAWYSRISNVRVPCIKCELITQIHKCANTQIQSAKKTQHVLYFWKAWYSRISNMTFPCIKYEIPKYTNTQITKTKCLKNPTSAIFLKSMGFKKIKCEISVYQMWNTQMCKYTNAKSLKDPTCAISLKSMIFTDIKYDIIVLCLVF